MSQRDSTQYPAIIYMSKESRKVDINTCICITDSLMYNVSSVQFSLAAQSCLSLFKPMNCRTTGFPVHHQLLELTQTHVH